ncbi:MAG: DUF4129 domain-containing protein [Microvirga sp.]
MLSGAALTVLLAAVAVASHAHRPGGGSGGGSSDTPRLLFEYTASVLFVLFPIGVLVVLWVMSLGRRQRLLQGGGPRRQFASLLVVCLIGLPAALATRHYLHFHSRQQQATAKPGSLQPGTDSRRRKRAEPEFQWLPALLTGSILFATAGGMVALVVWKRRQGAGWEREAELSAALDELLADTLDDLRAERDPRKAVIGAYARLERTFAAHDVERDPSETPREYVERALDRLGVSSFAVRRLTQLYERAKFSPHEIDAGMKDDAIEALAGLRAELDSEPTKAAA